MLNFDETLIFPEESSNKPWLHSAFPLHILAINGDPADIEKLLLAGEDVNKEDFLSTRPLHVAALSGHNEAVKLFLEHGAEVNDDSYYGITALHLAIEHEHYDTARLLIELGNADINYGKEFDETPFLVLSTKLGDYVDNYLKYENPETLKNIEKVVDFMQSLGPNTVISFSHDDLPLSTAIKSFVTQLPSGPIKAAFEKIIPACSGDYENYYINAKLLLHVFPTGNEYHFSLDGIEYTLNSEGFWGCYTTEYVLTSVHAYLNEIHLYPDNDSLPAQLFTKIEQSYELANTLAWHAGEPSAYEAALDAYHNGQTVLIPSGWDGHYVNIILSEPQSLFASANSGQRYYEYDAGVTFYKMADPELIDTDLIHDILTNEEETHLEYNLLYQYGLLEHMDFMPGDNQQFGNCALQSHREGIRGLLYTELLNEGFSSDDAAVKAESYFQNWNTFLSEYTVDSYFSSNATALPIDAYLDIFMDLNLDNTANLTQSDTKISQKFLDAVLTPEHMPEFEHWLQESANRYTLNKIETTFEPYAINVREILTPSLEPVLIDMMA